MSDFTPGPWTTENREMQGFDILAAIQGWSVNPVPIARVTPFPNAEKTANLIAAAPKMYEALELIKHRIEQCGGDIPEYIQHAAVIAREAMNAADGR